MHMLILMCIHNIQKYLKYRIFKIIPNLKLRISKHNNKINNWYRNSNIEHPIINKPRRKSSTFTGNWNNELILIKTNETFRESFI